VSLKAGKVIAYDALRLNTITGNLEFKFTDKAYDVINPMREFTLGTLKFRKGFEAFKKQTTETFYQVMYDGKQKLLCYRLGSIYLDSPYNSATKTKKFELDETYYLQKNRWKTVRIKEKPQIYSTFNGR